MLALVPAPFAIIAGSVGLVSTALLLGDRLHDAQALTGAVVLAALTGIPNVEGGDPSRTPPARSS